MSETSRSKERTVLLVSGDLMARERVRSAAAHVSMAVRYAAPGVVVDTLRSDSVDVLVLDLDSGRTQVLQEVEAARTEGLLPRRVLGYFSHVDGDLGHQAERAGVTAVRRGRFWASLGDLLAE